MNQYFPQHHRPGLFRTSAWLSAWLTAWGTHPRLKCLSDINTQPLASGLCSFTDYKLRILPLKTIIPVGVATGVAPSIRGEYFCFEDPQQLKYLLDESLNHSWDQFYIPDLMLDSIEFDMIQDFCAQQHFSLLIRDKTTSYGVDVRSGTFADYLKNLGSNTRLKLFNRRTKLKELGALRVTNIWPDSEKFIALINQFHWKRWGEPCFLPRNTTQIINALNNLTDAGHSVDLSVLSLDDKPLSVMLDINVNGRVYNLQSGYIENFMHGVSLGTLHFGFQIEAAFNSPNVDYYDFMAGKGKHCNYKEAIANAQLEFVSVSMVKPALLKLAYRVNDYLKGYQQPNI
ncbi:MAG TPA: hypothetical protein DIW64_13820 [Cellvibrio sp.]|nr:hypothetical protein [Cellvibrio sp.]